jgi:hypothetical protein
MPRASTLNRVKKDVLDVLMGKHPFLVADAALEVLAEAEEDYAEIVRHLRSDRKLVPFPDEP